MLAYCGLQCDSCPIFLATLEKDKSKQLELRKSIAADCREHYNMQLRPEDITDCDGCTSDSGRIFQECSKCKIRKCVQTKRLESCAYCKDFACSKLNELFDMDPTAKIRLQEIRNIN